MILPSSSIQNVSSPGNDGNHGFSKDTPVDPLPVDVRGRSLLFMYGILAIGFPCAGDACRKPKGRAAEAVDLGKLFPRGITLLCLSLVTSDPDVVTVPLPVVDEMSNKVLSLAIF